MSEIHVIDFVLRPILSPEASSQIERSYSLLGRTASVVRQMSGSASLNVFMAQSQRAIMVSNQLRAAINAAKVAMLGAGPIGWFMFGLSIVETGISVVQTLPEDSLDMELDAT